MLRERENANMDWKYALDNERNIKSSLVQAGQLELAGRRKAEADLAEVQRELERERDKQSKVACAPRYCRAGIVDGGGECSTAKSSSG